MKNNNMDLKDISFDESDKNLFQIDDLRLKADALNLEEIAAFWDTHSVADFWEQTKEVEFEVRASRRKRITIEPELYARS